MADYVRRGGLDISPPPWRCERIRATIFYVPSDRVKLQEICDRTLNRPSDSDPARPGCTRLKYKPIADWVALTFQSFDGMHSLAPPDSAGSLRERHTYREAALWVMAQDDAGLEVMIPYMFIDDSTCLAAGREIYGFPKEYGAITIPHHSETLQQRFAVTALVVDPGRAEAHDGLVFECVHEASAQAPWFPEIKASMPVLHGVEVFEAMRLIFEVFINGRLDFVFLRQFRALAGHGADLQQIVSASASPFTMNLLSINFLAGYELRFPSRSSHPMAQDFGWPPGSMSVPFGFQCDLAFTLQPGRVR